MKERIPFVDWLRAVACFMVMLVHASENFYGVVTEKAIACYICCAVTTKIISLLPGNRRPHWPPVWTLTHCLMSRTHDRAKHTANHSDRHNTRVSQWPVHRCHLSRLSIPYNTSHPGRCILHHSCHIYHRRYNLERPVYRCWLISVSTPSSFNVLATSLRAMNVLPFSLGLPFIKSTLAIVRNHKVL